MSHPAADPTFSLVVAMGLRFYVHVDEACAGGADHVFVVDLPPPWKPTYTIGALKQEYSRKYDDVYGTNLACADTFLADAHGVALPSSKAVHSVVRRGADLLICSAEPEAEDIMTDGAKALKEQEVCMPKKPKKAKPKPKAKAATAEPQLTPQQEQIQMALQKTAAAMKSKEWKTVRRIHNEIFKVDPTNCQARLEAALIEIDALQDYDAAEGHVNKALTARPKPTDPELFVTLGEALRGQTEYEDAVDAYTQALKLGQRKSQDWQHDVKILKARAYLALNPREANVRASFSSTRVTESGRATGYHPESLG